MPTFTIAFQPRFMFDRLFENSRALDRARAVIGQRVTAIDGIDMHPDLGLYFEEDNREWRQYFIPDLNREQTSRCPWAGDHEHGERAAGA